MAAEPFDVRKLAWATAPVTECDGCWEEGPCLFFCDRPGDVGAWLCGVCAWKRGRRVRGPVAPAAPDLHPADVYGLHV